VQFHLWHSMYVRIRIGGLWDKGMDGEEKGRLL